MRSAVFIFFISFSFIVFSQDFYLGADLSYVNEMGDCGAVYYDQNSQPKDPYLLFKENGANIVRVRLWHDPDSVSGYSFFNDVKKSIKRAKDLEIAVMLNFHYSDIWADPERQWVPLAWNHIMDNNVLADSIYSYTYRTLEKLLNLSLLPDFVQIGNETNGNILQKISSDDLRDSSPDNYPVNWERQTLLLNAGIQALDDFNATHSTAIKSIIHIAQPENLQWWFENAIQSGLSDFDVIGFSYYPRWSNMDIREVATTVQNLKEMFDKDVMMVEVAYNWIGHNNTLETRPSTHSQNDLKNFLIELTYLLKQAGALGIIYWEPAWVDTACETLWGSGSSADSQIFFDDQNVLHEAIEWLSYDYDLLPIGLLDQEVTFTVDMSGHSNTEEVYVTGSFTGSENWQFIELTQVSNEIYSATVSIPGRSAGAYIFYFDDTWSEEFREVVPISCADFWETHRKYIVMSESVTYSFAWSECDSDVDNPILAIEEIESTLIYPNPATKEIRFKGTARIYQVEIFDVFGDVVISLKNQTGPISINHLSSGIYVLKITSKDGSFKFDKLLVK